MTHSIIILSEFFTVQGEFKWIFVRTLILLIIYLKTFVDYTNIIVFDDDHVNVILNLYTFVLVFNFNFNLEKYI